tara:strand:- start:395 stop:1795 length:1401 start_codon:yes stop_codon:yes gene_type:complete
MEDNIQKLASMGRFEDDQIAHVATGEMIVPPVISPVTRMMIEEDMLNQGMDPNQYIVGGNPSINPRTGLQEFFIKKLFKKVKNVVKKVAPIAVSFIPGIGPVATGALTAVAGKASGLSTKEALLGGLTAGVGAKIAAGRAAAAGAAGTAGTAGAASKVAGEAAKKGIFGGTLGPRIRSGLGSFFKPGEDATGIFGGKLGPNIRKGIGNVFSGGLGGGQQEVMYQDPETGQIYSQSEVDQMIEAGTQPDSLNQVQTGPFGGTLGPKLRQTFLGSGDQPGVIGNILSGGQQTGTQQGGGFGLGGAGGIAGLAALYGLATKKQAEKTEGGQRDIRLSTRPDLMPQQTFQGFDVGVRPGMSYGGALGYRPGFAMGTPDGLIKEMIGELDLRPGGPSVGPGTETSDDIPAMLSDGEFVHTAKANKGLGGFKIEKNKNSITLYPTGKPDREQGFKNNDMMMKMFEDYQEMVS